MCRLIKNNKLVVLTLYSSYLYPLVQVLCSVLDQDLLNKPHHVSHTNTLVFNCELYCLYISSSSFLPTIHYVQASSCCARPKYALHAPSNILKATLFQGKCTDELNPWLSRVHTFSHFEKYFSTASIAYSIHVH